VDSYSSTFVISLILATLNIANFAAPVIVNTLARVIASETAQVSFNIGENSVVRIFRTTAGDGKVYTQKFYDLQAIIAVGFKANSQNSINFRAWAADVLAEFAMKGYVLDKERFSYMNFKKLR